MWKSSVVNASDHIFPGLAYHDRKKEFYDIGIFVYIYIYFLCYFGIILQQFIWIY